MSEDQHQETNEIRESGQGKKRVNWFLVLLIVAPFALLIGREITRGGLIGYLRAADAGDLLLLSPLYVIILIYMLFYMTRYGAPARIQMAFIAFSFVFVFGQSMHFTANAINTFATEVNDYKDILPKDLYTLIFDLDERLSHWILLGGAIGLIAIWFLYDRKQLSPPLFPNNLILVVLVGAIWGMVMALSVIEARMVIISLPVLFFLAGLWIYYWRRSGHRLVEFAIQRPFTGFVIVLVIFSLTFMFVWGVLNGGFPQPSELGI
jgi:hypothetical protein